MSITIEWVKAKHSPKIPEQWPSSGGGHWVRLYIVSWAGTTANETIYTQNVIDSNGCLPFQISVLCTELLQTLQVPFFVNSKSVHAKSIDFIPPYRTCRFFLLFLYHLNLCVSILIVNRRKLILKWGNFSFIWNQQQQQQKRWRRHGEDDNKKQAQRLHFEKLYCLKLQSNLTSACTYDTSGDSTDDDRRAKDWNRHEIAPG